jgi:hypothetical protein
MSWHAEYMRETGLISAPRSPNWLQAATSP